MKHLPPALQAHLDQGTTTLAWCWRLNRRDGVTLGFTDHDRDLAMDGITYEAATGFTASEIKDSVGLSVDNLDVASALTSARLDEHDLAAGLYDAASVEIWRVNWADPVQRVLMRKGTLGEIRRAGYAFSAEVRGLAQALSQPKGRLYQHTCDADLGDSRCGVDLSHSTLRGTGSVLTVLSARQFSLASLAAFPAAFFTRGVVRFTTGPNANLHMEVRRHSLTNGIATLELWQPMAHSPMVGDLLTVTAGCDKHFKTCRDTFANAARFRGFPHLPGNDFLAVIARPGEVNDGSPLR
jgi:uncharacterized phage protein (TIGR02218 family)